MIMALEALCGEYKPNKPPEPKAPSQCADHSFLQETIYIGLELSNASLRSKKIANTAIKAKRKRIVDFKMSKIEGVKINIHQR